MAEMNPLPWFPLPRDHCEEEPIRFPGSIQPTGVLLCVDPHDQTIVASSANHALIPNLDCSLAGRPLAEVWPALAAGCRDGAFMVGDAFAVHSHVDERTRFIEIEVCTEADRPSPRYLTEVGEALSGLHHAATLETVSYAAATAIRRLTGLERVLIYRFDRESNGEVVAESKVDDWEESFVGFHFPAADIPAQARALLLISPCRFVERRDDPPVPLVPALDPRTGQPFDLGRCRLRSVSPAHRLYQENLRVDGAMSVSIVEDGRLWGLVVGHHRRPHRVALPVREQVLAITTSLSMRVAATASAEERAARARHVGLHARLLRQIAGADDIVSPLIGGGITLADLFFASAGAVVVSGDDGGDAKPPEVFTVGCAPDPESILAFTRACRQHLVDGIFQTDHAAAILPAFADHAAYASGVLAVAVGEDGRHMVVWLRPETVRTVVWGGATPEHVEKEKSAGNYLPRTSFERWVEEHRGHSLPWRSWQIDIARSLRAALSDVLLRQMRTQRTLEVNAVLHKANAALEARTAELEAANRSLIEARKRAEAANTIKSEFLSVMNHEFRTPLNAVIGFSALLAGWENTPPGDPEYRAFGKRILEGGKSLLALLDDILKLSSMATGDLRLETQPLPLWRLVDQTIKAARARTPESGVQVAADRVDRSLLIVGDERLLNKALTHILLNAIKFSHRGGTVDLTARRDGAGRLLLIVADHGIGIAEADLEKALAPFMQADSSATRRYEGAGLGLPLAQRVIEYHGGTLSLDSAAGVGTTVTISLPPDRIVGAAEDLD